MKCTQANSSNSSPGLANGYAEVAALDPPALFHWLGRQARARSLCIECGAGLGELTAFFASEFDRAFATDIAPPERASPYGIEIVRACAEALPFADNSADLVFSMQALHFFDVPAHLAEARRVLRAGGVFAALGWGEMILPDAIKRAYRPVLRSIAPYWEPQRDWLLSGYAGLKFEATALIIPRARMVRTLSLERLDAQIAHWSGTQRALAAGAGLAEPALENLPLQDDDPFEVSWPLLGQVFRV